MKSLNIRDVDINGGFFGRYQDLIREKSIPYQWEALNDRVEGAAKSGCIENFRKAARIVAGKAEGDEKFYGFVFQDSDLYKWLETAYYCIGTLEARKKTLEAGEGRGKETGASPAASAGTPSEIEDEIGKLRALTGEAVDLIASAQCSDGYLDTYYIIGGLDKRFTNLCDNHELYCFGHMAEAAVAGASLGASALLTVVERYAELLIRTFGPGEDQLHGYPGHEIAELALVKLYRLTGKKAYLDLAEYFIRERGKQPLYFEKEKEASGAEFFWKDSYMKYGYYQAAKPVTEQDVAIGHAVRAVYLYSGLADVAAETGDKELFSTAERLWNNIVNRQMYITGGIGQSSTGESFTFDYDLPNDTAYAETCAACGLIFFARRMFEATGDARYLDVMERSLYNGALSGISLDGTRYFYVNPLASDPEASEKDAGKKHVEPTRVKWFDCSCCPTNIARLIESTAAYAFYEDGGTSFIGLYANADTPKFSVTTAYPFENNVNIRTKERIDTLALRIPSWCRSYTVTVDGEEFSIRNAGVSASGETGSGSNAAGTSSSAAASVQVKDVLKSSVCKGFLRIENVPAGADIVLAFDMPPVLVAANPAVTEDAGKAALCRGPLVFCLEEEDNFHELSSARISPSDEITAGSGTGILTGLPTLTVHGKREVLAENACRSANKASIGNGTSSTPECENPGNGPSPTFSSGDPEFGPLYFPVSEAAETACDLTFIPYFAWANRSVGRMQVWTVVDR